MKTVKDSGKEQEEGQLRIAVRNLIKARNAASDLNTVIVEENDLQIEFEISLEYPRYGDNQGKLQRRVSNLEIEEFIENIMSNIEEIIGCKYKRGKGFIFIYDLTDDNKRIDISNHYSYSYYNKLLVYKKIHINILFVEDRT